MVNLVRRPKARKVQPQQGAAPTPSWAPEDEANQKALAARIAKANFDLMQNGTLERPTIFQTFVIMITNSWMGLGDMVPTEELTSSLKDNFVNVGVVAALLLTLVSISTDDVGSELEQYHVSNEVAGQVFAVLSAASLLLLFVCVMHCLLTFCAVSELICVEEVVSWSRSLGKMIHMHYFFFIGGFLTYIVSQIWLALTVLKLPVAIVLLSIFLVVVSLPLYATTRSVQALYTAKIALAANHGFKLSADGTAASDTMSGETQGGSGEK